MGYSLTQIGRADVEVHYSASRNQDSVAIGEFFLTKWDTGWQMGQLKPADPAFRDELRAVAATTAFNLNNGVLKIEH